MFFTKYDKNTLIKNKFGIYEPIDGYPNTPNEHDIVIIPALAADKTFNRVGYGGGFYDKYLRDIQCLKIILIPDVLLEKNIPHETHDIKSDMIITENQILLNKINS